MKQVGRIILSGFMVLGLAACAEQQDWTPTVDTTHDPHQAMLNRDMGQCQEIASRASDKNSKLAEDTGIGTVAGAAGGAILGAMVGAPATGAGLGAAAGAGIGLGGGAESADVIYKRTYSNCLRDRGHPVLD